MTPPTLVDQRLPRRRGVLDDDALLGDQKTHRRTGVDPRDVVITSANYKKQQRVHVILDKIVMKPVLDNTDEVNDGCGLRICCFPEFDAGSELSWCSLNRPNKGLSSAAAIAASSLR